MRNGKPTWRLSTKAYGDELQFKFKLIQKKEEKEEVYFTFPRYSSQYNTYMTLLKDEREEFKVELELYADNMHCQIIKNLKLTINSGTFGFIRFVNRDKIPIAF